MNRFHIVYTCDCNHVQCICCMFCTLALCNLCKTVTSNQVAVC